MPCHLQDRTLAQADLPRAMQATKIAMSPTGCRSSKVIITPPVALTGRCMQACSS